MNAYDYDEGQPVVSRGTAERNFVAPAAPLATRQPAQIDVMPTWLSTAKVVDVAAVWGAQEAARETTNSVDRAKGVLLRLTPFALLWAGVGAVLGLAVWLVAGSAPGATLLSVLAFAGLTGFSYYKLNGQDYAHAAGGVERHRIDRATQLHMAELDHRARMQERMLDAHLRILERQGRE
jgi:hypothetical protein